MTITNPPRRQYCKIANMAIYSTRGYRLVPRGRKLRCKPIPRLTWTEQFKRRWKQRSSKSTQLT